MDWLIRCMPACGQRRGFLMNEDHQEAAEPVTNLVCEETSPPVHETRDASPVSAAPETSHYVLCQLKYSRLNESECFSACIKCLNFGTNVKQYSVHVGADTSDERDEMELEFINCVRALLCQCRLFDLLKDEPHVEASVIPEDMPPKHPSSLHFSVRLPGSPKDVLSRSETLQPPAARATPPQSKQEKMQTSRFQFLSVMQHVKTFTTCPVEFMTLDTCNDVWKYCNWCVCKLNAIPPPPPAKTRRVRFTSEETGRAKQLVPLNK